MEQLSLWDSPGQEPLEAVPDTPERWMVYSRADLRNHDADRRAWLREWAKMHHYPRSWFMLHGQRSGYYQVGIPAGEQGWTNFLECGIYYDVYCLFVAAYTPQIPLEHYVILPIISSNCAAYPGSTLALFLASEQLNNRHVKSSFGSDSDLRSKSWQ